MPVSVAARIGGIVGEDDGGSNRCQPENANPKGAC
jgi:hypothetical protein